MKKCTGCGISLENEAHQNGVCWDCYMKLDLEQYNQEQKKKKEFECEEQEASSYLQPTPPIEYVVIVGRLIADVHSHESNNL